MNRIVFWLLVSGAFALAQGNRVQCTAQHDKIVALPFRPSHISDSGMVAGTTSRNRAALWSESAGVQEVDLLAGYSKAEGVSINRAGEFVGLAMNPDSSKRQAFRYHNGQLSLLPGDQSKPLAIND